MRAGNCGRLSRDHLVGSWFRVLPLKHWKTRLASDHSRISNSRYSAASSADPLYRIVYLGETARVALHEARALQGNPVAPLSPPHISWVILALHVRLSHVIDLSLVSEQRKIGTNYAELTGNWANNPGVPPTQTLGQVLFNLPDVEGFIYPSSLTGESCLGIFPDKLGPSSSITFLNEINGRRERLT
jgi:hypothetical protein